MLAGLSLLDLGLSGGAATMTPWEAICLMPWGPDLKAATQVAMINLCMWNILCLIEIFFFKPRMKFDSNTTLNMLYILQEKEHKKMKVT